MQPDEAVELILLFLYFLTETLLKQFVNGMARLYGKSTMTFNVHQLLHLGRSVRCSGPLWATSAFTFESGNGQLLKHVTAAKGVPQQVIERALMAQDLRSLLSAGVVSEDAQQLCFKMLDFVPLNCASRVHDVCMLANGEPICSFAADESATLNSTLGYTPLSASEHERFIFKKQVFHSRSYKRAKKSDSSVIRCFDGRFAVIQKALRIANGNKDDCVLLCRLLTLKEQTTILYPGHILEVVASRVHKCVAVLPSEVEGICLYISFPEENACYVCCLPNTIEKV